MHVVGTMARASALDTGGAMHASSVYEQLCANLQAGAMEFVSSSVGKRLQFRGINARVVRSGLIRTGDTVRKMTHRDAGR